MQTKTENATEQKIFSKIKYKVTGRVDEELERFLQDGGAERLVYFSDYVTHCIVGSNPEDSDISEASDLYDLCVVSQDWVKYSTKCNKLLPTSAFKSGDKLLFSGVVATFSKLSQKDSKKLWAMLKYYGATFNSTFTRITTHLIVSVPAGEKYELALNYSNSVHIVTPDWVIDSIRSNSVCSENLYHPKTLIMERFERKTDHTTAHITGFSDNLLSGETSIDFVTCPEVLQQLKLKMPWNQLSQSTSSHSSSAQSSLSLSCNIKKKSGSDSLANPPQSCLGDSILKKSEQFLQSMQETGIYRKCLKNQRSLHKNGHFQPQQLSHQQLLQLQAIGTDNQAHKYHNIFQLQNSYIPQKQLYSNTMTSHEAQQMPKTTRQMVHVDSQTWSRLQKLDSQERIMFLQNLQKGKPMLPTHNQQKEKQHEHGVERNEQFRDQIMQSEFYSQQQIKQKQENYNFGQQVALLQMQPKHSPLKIPIKTSRFQSKRGQLIQLLQEKNQSSVLYNLNPTLTNLTATNQNPHFHPFSNAIGGTPLSSNIARIRSPLSDVALVNSSGGQGHREMSHVVSTVTEQYQQQTQSYCSNPEFKVLSDMFLIGCVFFIVEYNETKDKISEWHLCIIQYGGEIELSYTDKVTHIICQTQQHPHVQKGISEGRRCITSEWLNDVCLKKQALPPWLALHFPIPFEEENPCANLIISYSGFEGEERIRVKKMLETTGAKLTSYFSTHNHVLVCRKLYGEKYQKAREWGKSIVNVQWISDILLGCNSCLQEQNSEKYQQYNLDDPFCIDFNLVSDLLFAWQVPIKITRELCQRQKFGLPQKRPRSSFPVDDLYEKENKCCGMAEKRPKTPHSIQSHNIEGQKFEGCSTAEVNIIKGSCSPPNGPCILFSGFDSECQKEEIKRIMSLRGTVTLSASKATHLIMNGGVTLKFYCCLSTCKYIVTPQWLNDSFEQSHFLDESPYIYSNPELEKQYKFKLFTTLIAQNRHHLFQNKTFFLTPNVVPGRNAMREMIECAGGSVDRQRRSLRFMLEQAKYSYFVIAVAEDYHLVADVLSTLGVYSTEFVISCLLRQSVEREADTMFIKKS